MPVTEDEYTNEVNNESKYRNDEQSLMFDMRGMEGTLEKKLQLQVNEQGFLIGGQNIDDLDDLHQGSSHLDLILRFFRARGGLI